MFSRCVMRADAQDVDGGVTPAFVLRLAGAGLLLALAFWAALALVYCIPRGWMLDSLRASRDALAVEGLYPGTYAAQNVYDNFTVGIMLNEAAQDGGKNPFVAALESRYYSDGDKVRALEHAMAGESNWQYARYWHGYLVVLKPLLIVFGLKSIRLLLQTALLVLITVAAVKLTQRFGMRLGGGVACAFACAVGLFGGMDAAATLPVAPSFILSAAGVIWAVSVDRISLRRCVKFFALIGALTVYTDFLDNPVLTLGCPLAVVMLRLYADGRDVPYAAKTLVWSCVFWAAGYGMLWAAKWLLGMLFTDINVLEAAFESATFRLGVGAEAAKHNTTPITAIGRNLRASGIALYALVFMGVIDIALLVRVRMHGGACARRLVGYALLYVAVTMLPYLWFAVLSNHSTLHASIMVFRDQVSALFSLLTAAAFMLLPHEQVSVRTCA